MSRIALHLRCSASSAQQRRHARRGLTLTEIMIAITITLVLLGVLIRMFAYASGVSPYVDKL